MSNFSKFKSVFNISDWKSILSIAAFMTSLSALYISYQQLRISSEEQQAGVFPYLSMSCRTQPGLIELNLSNDGNGPAFISGVEVKIQDTVYNNCWKPVVDFLDTLPLERIPHFVKNDLLPGWVVRANSENWMIYRLDSLSEKDTEKFWKYYMDDKNGAQIKIWYFDLYNNCWEFDWNENRVKKCKKCPNEVLKR